MSVILHKKRWTNQAPPPGSRIDFGHPLAKGLTFYSVFNAGAGLQQALLPAGLPEVSVGTPPAQWSSTPGGLSHNWDGNWSSHYERGIWVEPPTNVSMVTRLRRTGTLASFGTPCVKTYQNNTNPFATYALNYNPSNAGQDVIRTFVATGGVATGGTTFNAGAGATLNVHTTAMSYTSGSMKLYYNGIQRTNDNVTGTLTYDQTTTGRFLMSGDSGVSVLTPWIGQVYYVGVWNRVLTQAENEWLHVEPYAMLVQKKQIKYFIPASVARAYSYWIVLERLS